MQIEKVPIIINPVYGGYGYSTKAIIEYNKMKIQHDPNFQPITDTKYVNETNISRTDHIMCQVVINLGNDASSSHAKLCVKWIPKEFLDYVEIYEYDGREAISGYYFDRYKIDKIKEILINGEPANEQIKKIEGIANSVLPDEYYQYDTK
mgnify:CR=1 FL=1